MSAIFDEFEISTSGVFAGLRKEHEQHSATLGGAHDGDTVYATVCVSPVFRTYQQCKLRIRGLWCAELDEPGGEEAKQFTDDWCINNVNCQVTLYGWSHDRVVADVVSMDSVSLKDAVIAAGFGSDKQLKGST